MKKTVWSACALVAGWLAGTTAVPQNASAQWGHVEGQFVLEGEAPELAVTITNTKAAECSATIPNQSLVVNPDNNGIANIVLYMRKKPSKVHPDLVNSTESEVVFDQKNCTFLPHVLVVRTDQTVLVKSSDPTNHNTRTSPFSNDAVNLTVKPNEQEGVPIKMPKSELRTPPVKVSCDIHPWMSAYWVVADHPYVAVTDADGKFRIENLPEGEHEFRVWQEKSGYVTTDKFEHNVKITVKDGETTMLSFKVPAASFNK